ncbi:hypothetical protein [Komagataeibacter xylinus]|nr:hypothetical protein [Komagataeibacter xylinus]
MRGLVPGTKKGGAGMHRPFFMSREKNESFWVPPFFKKAAFSEAF